MPLCSLQIGQPVQRISRRALFPRLLHLNRLLVHFGGTRKIASQKQNVRNISNGQSCEFLVAGLFKVSLGLSIQLLSLFLLSLILIIDGHVVQNSPSLMVVTDWLQNVEGLL